MGFWRRLLGIKSPHYNHELTADDRLEAVKVKQYNRSLREREQALRMQELEYAHRLKLKDMELQMAELDEQIAETTGDDGNENLEKYLMPLAAKFLTPGVGSSMNTPDVQNPTPTPRELTDQQIIEMWGKTPITFKKVAANMEDETLLLKLREIIPGFGEDTYDRAFKIIRGE
jgi:hypothetical protein